jgi:chromatin segregation and condensation protein Rec8/ScpA/Scc1 (kleisin family)
VINLTRENIKDSIDLIPDRDLDAFVSVFNAFLTRVKTEKHFISQEEFLSKLGITQQDIDNAEDDELI